LAFLDKNNDVFAWSTSDLVVVSKDTIEHRLQVNPNAKPRKQKLQKMSEEKVEDVKSWGSKIARRRLHQGSNLPSVVGKCGDGLEKE
jgi:hypothetical protein